MLCPQWSVLPLPAGELGLELVENTDKLVSGFISNFERGYSRLEKVVKSTISKTLLLPGSASPAKKAGAAAAAAAKKKAAGKALPVAAVQ